MGSPSAVPVPCISRAPTFDAGSPLFRSADSITCGTQLRCGPFKRLHEPLCCGDI
jgi:hypothetical protein